MKKTVLAVAAVFAASIGFAQNLTSDKGEAYLPETGDRALGFDAVPVLNLLKFNSSDKVSANYVDGMSVFGKHFHDANTACRYGVAFNWGSDASKSNVTDLRSGAAAGSLVENEEKNRNFGLMLSMGHEHRRGTGRVQGFCGMEGMLSLGTSSSENSFGNSLVDEYNADNNNTSRVLESKDGFSFGIGARAFVGVEYFVAPKLSLGAEYGLGLMYSSMSGGETTTETIVDNGGSVTANQETVEDNDRTRSFGLANDVNNGSVRLTFHF